MSNIFYASANPCSQLFHVLTTTFPDDQIDGCCSVDKKYSKLSCSLKMLRICFNLFGGQKKIRQHFPGVCLFTIPLVMWSTLWAQKTFPGGIIYDTCDHPTMHTTDIKKISNNDGRHSVSVSPHLASYLLCSSDTTSRQQQVPEHVVALHATEVYLCLCLRGMHPQVQDAGELDVPKAQVDR